MPPDGGASGYPSAATGQGPAPAYAADELRRHLRALYVAAGEPDVKELLAEADLQGVRIARQALYDLRDGKGVPTWRTIESFIAVCLGVAERHPAGARSVSAQWRDTKWLARLEVLRGRASRQPRVGRPDRAARAGSSTGGRADGGTVDPVRAGQVPGLPLERVTNPFAVEVHRAIALDHAGDLPPLPRYVRRAHDQRLAEVVAGVLHGQSRMAVLVAGSSAGKTRACWEALEPLRRAGGWRLWHPYEPTRREAALQGLDRVGPRTVVWLNETQEYLEGDAGERVAAKLRALLDDPTRGPVLVLGTVWPNDYATLTGTRGSQQVRVVLDGTVIQVPYTFAGPDLVALQQATGHDARLAWAAEHAEDGQITQYLAGGPALIDRFIGAPAEPQALILAAMDARRMGHRNAFPRSLLDQAAQAYLTDTQLQQLGDDWLEQALDYASQPCKGAPGPITTTRHARDRSRRGRRASADSDQPTYRLADYLDQYGRILRAERIPPIEFWIAAADHAHPGDLAALGEAARDRGLYRDAAQLYKNAATYGDFYAAHVLVGHLHTIHPDDARPAQWMAAQVRLNNADEVAMLLRTLHDVGATEQIADLLARDPAAHADLNDRDTTRLLRALDKVGAVEQVTALASRIVAHADIESPEEVWRLLSELHTIGATEQIAELLARDPAVQVAVEEPGNVGMLLHTLHEVGAAQQVTALAGRAVHVALDLPGNVGMLLHTLHEVGAAQQVTALAGRAVHVALDAPSAVAMLLHTLHEVGATKEMAALLARTPAAHVPLDDPHGVASLLHTLHEVGATEEMAALLARSPAANVPLDDPECVHSLLYTLHAIGAADQAHVFTKRVVSPSNPVGQAMLLGMLHELRATEQITELLARDPATHVDLNDPFGIAMLLTALNELGATKQTAELLARDPATHVHLNDPFGIAMLLTALNELGATKQTAELLARDPATHVHLNDLFAVQMLVEKLHELGTAEHVSTLAARIVRHGALNTSDNTVTRLLDALRGAGVTEARELVDRLPAAGRFSLFVSLTDKTALFRFGRDPDAEAAERWDWTDLVPCVRDPMQV